MKIFKRILIFLLFCVLTIISILYFKGYKLYKDSIDEVSLTNMVTKLQTDNNYVSIDSLPDYYKNAVIAVEDHRFEKHGAIDFIAIGRAIVRNVSNFKLLEGGSTITQQVANNLYFIDTDTPALIRKVAEIFVAFDLEKQYSKKQIFRVIC